MFDPFESGEATRNGSIITSLVSTRPGYRLLGAEVVNETLLSITFCLEGESNA